MGGGGKKYFWGENAPMPLCDAAIGSDIYYEITEYGLVQHASNLNVLAKYVNFLVYGML